jgi:hypothetical protein
LEGTATTATTKAAPSSTATWEEMFCALLFGKSNQSFIKPLEMERKDPDHVHMAL